MVIPTVLSEPQPAELSWLGEVREVRQPLSRMRPIWVRSSYLRTGPPGPCPTVPHPERHPYCEFSICLQGHGIEYIGRGKLQTNPGSVMLLGPGIPHTAELHDYPRRGVTVYFLPILLFDMGPLGDGARVLSRFTAEQSIEDRIVNLPPGIYRRIRLGMAGMAVEFQRGGFGSELRLRSMLTELLVALLRWEEKKGKRVPSDVDPLHWELVQRALHYLQEHYTEPIYVREVARATGVSESRLKLVFRESLGMSCVQYLKAYRISLAAAMLSAAKDPITTVALAVGFETLSHFNTTFREIMDMSPTEYIMSVNKARTRESKSI